MAKSHLELEKAVMDALGLKPEDAVVGMRLELSAGEHATVLIERNIKDAPGLGAMLSEYMLIPRRAGTEGPHLPTIADLRAIDTAVRFADGTCKLCTAQADMPHDIGCAWHLMAEACGYQSRRGLAGAV